MKNKFLFITCAIITSIIGFSGGFMITKAFVVNKDVSLSILNLTEKESTETETSVSANILTKHEIVKIEKKIEKTLPPQPSNCPLPKKVYEDESYLDVGQDIGLEDKSYTPTGLVELNKSIAKFDNLCIKEEVADALEDMIDAARRDGYIIKVSSGFRDYNTQRSIVDRETKNGNKNVSIAVAKPGYSEHQLGVAVDLTSKSIAYASAAGKFADAPEYKWLEEHASQYGFVESYPKDKEDITGYMYEPWHYRYVGIENAKEITESGQTINEYLKNRKEN